jgi:hypothetical protein
MPGTISLIRGRTAAAVHRFGALRPGRQLALALLALAGPAGAAGLIDDLSVGGSLSLTSDYIYRGLAESDGHGAAQLDVHLDSGGGTYLGVWASTRDRELPPGAADELEAYLGQRFQLGSTWSANVEGRAHYYVAGTPYTSFDYQEVATRVTYLDRWSFSVTAIPNAVRYWYSERLSRAPAWVADTSGQWLLTGGLFATGGLGYYYASGRSTAQAAAYYGQPPPPPPPSGAGGYAYGNAGLAYEVRRWRLSAGYFLTQGKAQQLAPYPLANHRVAATVSWRF